jgi:hypothetical protein
LRDNKHTVSQYSSNIGSIQLSSQARSGAN